MSGPRLQGPLERRPNGSQWAALLDLALPALDHALPGEPHRIGRGEKPRWTLGGGTALALRIGHRTSDDIDVFVVDVRLAELGDGKRLSAHLTDGLRHHLLVFGGDAAPLIHEIEQRGLGDLVTVKVVGSDLADSNGALAKVFGAERRPSAFLVRPDLYLTFAGADERVEGLVGPLGEALERTFTAPPATAHVTSAAAEYQTNA